MPQHDKEAEGFNSIYTDNKNKLRRGTMQFHVVLRSIGKGMVISVKNHAKASGGCPHSHSSGMTNKLSSFLAAR